MGMFDEKEVGEYSYRRQGDIWNVTCNDTVAAWIKETLPAVFEYHGELMFNQEEYTMLTLKFGVGKDGSKGKYDTEVD